MAQTKSIDAALVNSTPEECYLILTEGDSATAFVTAGLAAEGFKRCGVVTLKGMFPNVRDNPKCIRTNVEIRSIVEMLGLQYDKDCEDAKKLRYGHVIIMTDQDHHGHHIKGLVLNMFEYLWPSLLKVTGFLQMFITPIVTAVHKEPKGQAFKFFTMLDFGRWQSENDANDYRILYHKGLASFTINQAKYFFRNFEEHLRIFERINDEDNAAIKVAFSGQATAKRKWLLEGPQAVTSYFPANKPIRYFDFINGDVRQALLDHGQRSIASIVDGFKRSARKIFHCALEDPEIQESSVLVEAFSGHVAKNTFYHHGEGSLDGVIIGMAQDFVGRNNINLFLPHGHFGTRVEGPSYHGGGRYIYTSLSPVALHIFHKDDKLILEYLYEGGKRVEPSRLYPIIPMILVNGSEGIAPGWRSFIPQYNPREVIVNLMRLLNDQEVNPMLAWYKGFTGAIRQIQTGYETEGEFVVENDVIKITELPVRVWNQAYEKTLKNLQDKNEIESYTAYHSNTDDVCYRITMSEDEMKKAKQQKRKQLLKKFKLTKKLATTTMNLIDENGVIKKYSTPTEILEQFFKIRLKYYGMRKDARLLELKKAQLMLESKIRYAEEARARTIDIFKDDDAIFAELKRKGYKPLPSIVKLAERAVLKQTHSEEEEEVVEMFPETGYDYLRSLRGNLLTPQGLQKLEEEMDSTKKDYDALQDTSPKKLWLSDLDHLSRVLDNLDELVDTILRRELANLRI